MLPKGKSRAELILLRLKDSKDREKTAAMSPEDDESEEKDGNPGLTTAMEEFLSAVKKGDAEAMSAALCSFIEIHEGDEGDEEPSEDEEAL